MLMTVRGVPFVLSITSKSELVKALCCCVDDRQQSRARRFLEGLSRDELQYIAEFLGSRILEKRPLCVSSREQLVEAIQFFESRCREAVCAGSGSKNQANREHKMILLFEYLCRTNHSRVCSGPAGRR
jgi:hypothetical protein